MHEHHLKLNAIPPGHPGASSALAGDESASDPIRRAMAEAELLRARIREMQRDGVCDCPALEPGWI
jgi:hypothetical protein